MTLLNTELFELGRGYGSTYLSGTTNTIRVLVCGGRNFDDAEFLFAQLDRFHDEYRFIVVIEGEARGADKLSSQWAEARGIAVEKYPADWSELGRKAGPLRNEKMLREGKPDLVVAFPGGHGTAHMCRIAEKAGVRVIKVIPLG